MTMSECGLMKLLLNILFEKKLIFQHWKWPARGTCTASVVYVHFHCVLAQTRQVACVSADQHHSQSAVQCTTQSASLVCTVRTAVGQTICALSTLFYPAFHKQDPLGVAPSPTPPHSTRDPFLSFSPLPHPFPLLPQN